MSWVSGWPSSCSAGRRGGAELASAASAPPAIGPRSGSRIRPGAATSIPSRCRQPKHGWQRR
eukprot:5558246-Lingulodinium_polyedra.AAC.1